MITHKILLAVMIVAIAFSLHDARDGFLWILEALPVLLGLAVLVVTYPFYNFTIFTYVLIMMSFFMILIGAHYTYEHVPLFSWMKEEFGFARNHYDRLGHFFQGVVPAIVIREWLVREGMYKKKIMSVIIVLSCLGLSALYEIAEMTASFFVEGATIDWFLGLQGDEWDTQKDMVMALTGAAAALLVLGRLHDKQIQIFAQKQEI